MLGRKNGEVAQDTSTEPLSLSGGHTSALIKLTGSFLLLVLLTLGDRVILIQGKQFCDMEDKGISSPLGLRMFSIIMILIVYRSRVAILLEGIVDHAYQVFNGIALRLFRQNEHSAVTPVRLINPMR